MKKATLFRRLFALCLAVVLVLGVVPVTSLTVSAAATVETKYQNDQWNSAILRAWEYLGAGTYKPVSGLKNDNKLFTETDPDVLADYHTGILYPKTREADYSSAQGIETVSGQTYTGYKPDINTFRNDNIGMVCAGFTTYFVLNYMKNVEGLWCKDFENAIGVFTRPGSNYNYRGAETWYYCLEELTGSRDPVISGCKKSDNVDKIYDGSFGGYDKGWQDALAKMEPGDIIVYGYMEERDDGTTKHIVSHVSIYAGSNNGTYFQIHCAGPRGSRGATIAELSADYGIQTLSADKRGHPIGVYHLTYTPLKETSITVKKEDENGTPLAGAVFTATHNEYGTIHEFPATGADGTTKLENIPFGTYTIKETKAPDGYVLLEETKTVTVGGPIDDPETVYHRSVTVINEPESGDLKIIKTTDTDMDLAGWKFEVRNSRNVLVGTYTITEDDVNNTKKQGVVIAEDLEPGVYTVTEIIPTEEPNSNYEPETRTQTVEVKYGGENSVTFHNTIKRGSIKVEKTDPGDEPLAGAVFTATHNKFGTKYTFPATDNKGFAKLEDLPYGTYTVKEIEAPPGYILPTTTWTVTVGEGDGASINYVLPVTNDPINQTLKIIKTTDTDESLAGWEFKVYRKSDNSLVGTYTTTADDANKQGIVLVQDLVPGEYIVEEIVPPDADYVCASVNPQTVEVKFGGENSVTFHNTVKRCSITVQKAVNTGNEEDKYGWTIELYRDSVSADNLVMSDTTSAENGGVVKFEDLLPGKYIIHEKTEKEFWVNVSGDITVELQPGENVTKDLENEQRGDLEIIKVVLDGDASVAGWEFEITNITDPENPVVVPGSHVTVEREDEDGNKVGIIRVEDLEEGTYQVKEIIPEGSDYICNSVNPQTITVVKGETAKVTFENRVLRGSIVVQKITNSANDEYLKGWEIELYLVEGAKETLLETKTTDQNGQVLFSNLMPGKYIVREKTEKDFWIDHTGDITVELKPVVKEVEEVSLENGIYGDLKIVKKVLDGDASVAGWQFKITNITDPENPVELPGSHVTVEGEDEDGNKVGIIQVEDLEEGTYLVEEIIPEDSDYVCIGENPRKVEVKAGQVNEVTFENELEKGEVKIIKTTNTGEDLEGWKFNIYTDKEKTTLVDGSPFTTDEDGFITERLLPGTYYIEEVDESDSKPGWIFDTELKEATIEVNKTTEVTFTNKQQGQARIIKTVVNGDASVEGWTFRITNITDAENPVEVGEFTTDADGIICEYLLPGTYQVEELTDQNPAYYSETKNPVTVEIAAGETKEIPFTNTLKLGEFEIIKVDTCGNPLEGAIFLVEWSEDGKEWAPVTFCTVEDAMKGGCTSEGLTDGKLVTGKDGIARFTGLWPDLYYRVSEAQAPPGYWMQKKIVFEDRLTQDDLDLSWKVVNKKMIIGDPDIPNTGDINLPALIGFSTLSAVCILGMTALLHFERRRKKIR